MARQSHLARTDKDRKSQPIPVRFDFMATILFKRVKVIGGSYLSLVGVGDVKPRDNFLAAQEYRIVCGDISCSVKEKQPAMRKLRVEMRKDGHKLETIT
jgi:hypothetical protein